MTDRQPSPVGAGPAGLTAALAAAKRGFSVECFEARTTLEERGAWLVGKPAQDPTDWVTYVDRWESVLAREILSGFTLAELHRCAPLESILRAPASSRSGAFGL